jgi:hypothetical protein
VIQSSGDLLSFRKETRNAKSETNPNDEKGKFKTPTSEIVLIA